ncbi:SDR family oxidoreductase [Pseudomonas citronellolis]|uniref:SDR family oxidoreductase n=1 Tax=Pseudomonas citronellolis TaxID=53408 RepID=UPI00209F1C45|nr:SDR family oxidoreductase [Pseudomonas citronellolis]MCP1608245.1 NAD(P)-dependent dehydrogenase (short-subunit alcohol dehydrogenase family) [Pseudomonas citronellolis]MCP1658968.1 NAD(P)-dependent dehydrogenase (short-subunit alcohol dehydrogenase family) [Pseudomonas citronellolis]MCP1725933.1 NAD(P)-dependent dehydrogenase (short-subunit alcohol dehydrogenase family) [Pseudomonas citronellolis]
MSTANSALIIGASRGLGLGLVNQLLARGWEVTATVRDAANAGVLDSLPVRVESLVLDDAASQDRLAAALAGQRFDLVYINAGIYGPAHQSALDASLAEVGELFMVNAVAPLRLAERLLPLLEPQRGVLAFMTSELGSVAGNESGGMGLYRASKAALNSLTRSLVAGLGETGLTVLNLHPGWVRTDMGGEAAPLDVETSAAGLIDQVEAYAGRGGQHYLDYQGTTIDW